MHYKFLNSVQLGNLVLLCCEENRFPSSAHQADEGFCLCFLVLETKVAEKAFSNISSMRVQCQRRTEPTALQAAVVHRLCQRSKPVQIFVLRVAQASRVVSWWQ